MQVQHCAVSIAILIVGADKEGVEAKFGMGEIWTVFVLDNIRFICYDG